VRVASHLPCANEDGLKEAAVDAANPREACLLHQYRHSVYPDGEVRRLRCSENDFLRGVVCHELEGHVVERTVPTADLGKAALTLRPRPVTVVLGLDRSRRRRDSVVPHRDDTASLTPKAPKELLEGTTNLILGKHVRQGVVAGEDDIERRRADGKSPHIRNETAQSKSATRGLLTGAVDRDGRDVGGGAAPHGGGPVNARPRPESNGRLARISFLDAMQDPALFGPWSRPESSWAAWRVFAKALFGLALDAGEVEVFSRHTGRSTPPTAPAREAWVPVGRRGGKSIFAAALAVYMATFRDYLPHLKPGERAVVMVLAAEKDQAGVVFDYIAGFFDNVPMLAGLVEKRGKGKESIRLRNRVTIRVQVASFRRLRGRTVACAILDENAFWYSDEESRNPDTEILKALRPSMATIPGSLLIAISSPYAKRGILWDAYRRYFGKDGARVLV